MNYSISVTDSFDARHYVVSPNGQVEEPHFHTWSVKVTVSSKKLDNLGFVMDFHDLLQIVKDAYLPLVNCSIINSLSTFKDNPPTAERMAEFFVNQLLSMLPDKVKLVSVEIEESKNCIATITMS